MNIADSLLKILTTDVALKNYAGFLAARFLAAGFLAAGFLAAGLDAAGFFTTDLDAADFLAVVFLTADFLATGFFFIVAILIFPIKLFLTVQIIAYSKNFNKTLYLFF